MIRAKRIILLNHFKIISKGNNSKKPLHHTYRLSKVCGNSNINQMATNMTMILLITLLTIQMIMLSVKSYRNY